MLLTKQDFIILKQAMQKINCFIGIQILIVGNIVLLIAGKALKVIYHGFIAFRTL